ncbi:MAG TPA: hypothetical protein VES02_05715 [Dermatophilaceae bacterium]|nr:hypothetical protein [Dermatophilaceae bacterium]
MEPRALLIAIGAFLLAGVGYLVLQVVGDLAAEEAKEAVFRRPSFAVRRSRHRALMKTGYVCAVLGFLAAFFCLAAATSGREADAADARIFAMLAAVLTLAAGGLLTTWWRRSDGPQR